MTIPSSLLATSDDFILAVTLQETIELTNKDNAAALIVNEEVLQAALDDALAEIQSYDFISKLNAKVLIRSTIRRNQIILARYYLDTLKLREDVKEQAEKVLDFLRSVNELAEKAGPVDPTVLAMLGLSTMATSGKIFTTPGRRRKALSKPQNSRYSY